MNSLYFSLILGITFAGKEESKRSHKFSNAIGQKSCNSMLYVLSSAAIAALSEHRPIVRKSVSLISPCSRAECPEALQRASTSFRHLLCIHEDSDSKGSSSAIYNTNYTSTDASTIYEPFPNVTTSGIRMSRRHSFAAGALTPSLLA